MYSTHHTDIHVHIHLCGVGVGVCVKVCGGVQYTLHGRYAQVHYVHCDILTQLECPL